MDQLRMLHEAKSNSIILPSRLLLCVFEIVIIVYALL